MPGPNAQIMKKDRTVDTAILDVDGTLVDSNYHHARAWHRAFAEVGVIVPTWRIHRAIGMSGDRLVRYVAGETVEDACGDHIRAGWERAVDANLHEIRALSGAGELLDQLKHRGLKIVLATSGKPEHTEHALTVLDARHRIDHLVTSADVDASKPAPDLLTTACDAVGGTAAIMIGDTVWDARAACAAGMRMIGLLSGGVGRHELLRGGADQVYADPQDLIAHLDEAFSAHPPAMSA